MARLFHAILLGLVGAAIVHIAVLLLVPTFSERDAWSNLAMKSDFYTMARLDADAGSPAPVKSIDPQFYAAACRFDLADGMIQLTAPGSVPFWSVSVYDQATRCLINNGTERADRSSRHDLVTNADGSVDLYFGPETAPEGMENNFIRTNAGDGFFVYFRLYAPTEPYFEKSWPLPDLKKIN